MIQTTGLSRVIGKLILLSTVALLTACATAPEFEHVSNPPHAIPLQVIGHRDRPLIAFVLGSGAARGFAHVGVLDVLDRNGIKANIIVGSSAGSVVAALYAAGIRNDKLLEAAQKLDMEQLTDWTFPNRGIVRGELLQEYINKLLDNRPIESLPVKFVAIATDLANGNLIAFNTGNTGMAVRASSSVPGIVQPTTIDGRDYVDGGLVSQVPVRIARQMGADIVIAVDVSRTLMPPEQLTSTAAVMRQAMLIAIQRITEEEIGEADIIIRPEVGNIAADQFELRDQAVAAGKTAALARISDIRQIISDWYRKTR